MLTEEQMRDGIINPPSRWPNRVVPFLIDDVFSEYCSTKLQIGMRGVEGTVHDNEYRFSSKTHWSLGGRSKGDSYLPLHLKTHKNSHSKTHT
jgi:hypothetical protein